MTPLQQNDSGPWVWEAQRLLNLAGFTISYDGTFSDAMTQTVKDFQARKNISADGKITEATWQSLGWMGDVHKKRLTDEDFVSVAAKLDVEVAAVKAVCEVESRGSGFLADGRPKILFEGHVFWKQLVDRKKDPQAYVSNNEDILYPKWTKAHYRGKEMEYERLNRAKAIDYEAAIAAASWGTFQIMGFNYGVGNYSSSVIDYVNKCYVSEGEHLKAFAAFITQARLVEHLKNKNWEAFAERYNGSGYKENRYDEKLAEAYKKYA